MAYKINNTFGTLLVTLPDGTNVPAQPGGAALLFALFEAELRNSVQNTTIAAIDAWDNLRIAPGQTRHAFIQLFRLTLDEALSRGNTISR